MIERANPDIALVRHPRVRAVVVSWNGAHLLPSCLDSLLAQTIAADLEVVVVDNASEDGTAAMLAERYPGVVVVRSESNLGFAGGADLGVAGFAGAFIALLNNDATFAVDAIERMISVMEQPGNERVGAVTAKILLAGAYRLERGLTEATAPTGSFRRDDGWLVPADPGSPGAIRVVNSTGNVVTRRGTGTDRDWLRTEGEESRDADVFGFCGGAALLRRRGAGRGRRVRSRALPLLRGHRPVVAPARGRVDGPILRAGGRPPPARGQLGQRRARCSATTTRATHSWFSPGTHPLPWWRARSADSWSGGRWRVSGARSPVRSPWPASGA